MAFVGTLFPEGEARRAAGVSTFVSVGNARQPFVRLVRGVLGIVQELPQPVVIQHGNTPAEDDRRCVWVPFVGMEEFARKLSEAELVIIHAGAGSIIHALQAGRTPVVMPRRSAYGEHVDDHQVELAEALARERRVVLAMEPENLVEAAREALTRQRIHEERHVAEPRLVALVRGALERCV